MLWFSASALCIWQAVDFKNILDASPSKCGIFTCLPMNQMCILHAHGNQLAFHSALPRAKSINSKHRWPGWPTSAFLVCLAFFNAFSIAISKVSCRKSSNSSAVTTASKMCRDRCCTMVSKGKRLHSNIFPRLSLSKQRNSLHKDTFFFSEIQCF